VTEISSNLALEPTAYSVRSTPASGGGSPRALYGQKPERYMTNREQAVASYWTVTNLGDTILTTLQRMGKGYRGVGPRRLGPH